MALIFLQIITIKIVVACSFLYVTICLNTDTLTPDIISNLSDSSEVLGPFQYDRFYAVYRNRYIVFMGDSLMRYQYLSLVYSLKYRIWPTDDEKPNLYEGNHICFLSMTRSHRLLPS